MDPEITTAAESTKLTHPLFQIDGKPTLAQALPISIQHIFAMIVANVAPALIVAQSVGLSAGDSSKLVQFCMFTAGVATLMQVIGIWRFGSKLPLIMGMNFAFVPVVINIAKTYGFAASYGATIIAGLFVILLGTVILKIRRFFPPLVTGTTVLTMGISLYPVAIDYMAGGVGSPDYASLKNWLVALLTLVIVVGINQFARGYLRVLGMLIGIVIGYGIAAALGMVHLGNLTAGGIITAPQILPFGIKFETGAIITMVVMYLVTSVEVIGDTSSLTIGTMNREATGQELSGAILGKGVTAILAALLGGLPTATFSQNVGIVTVTKVIARRVFIFAAAIMVLVGFFPPFGALMTSIPSAVLGGATLSVFAIITINGLKLLSQEVMTMRNATILGISLAFGLGLTSVPAAVANAPEAFKTFISSSPVILSTAICFILNLLIPRTTLEEEAKSQKMQKD